MLKGPGSYITRSLLLCEVKLACLYCEAEFHLECESFDVIFETTQDDSFEIRECCCRKSLSVETTGNKRGGPRKEDDEVTDPKSTGRKRAAVAYPLEDEEGNAIECEWSGLRFAGGGISPIIGCVPGVNKATNRHHGPDKNTLNNSSGNVHRICSWCHNRWHTKNDPLYVEKFETPEWKAHDPETKADVATILGNEAYWQTHPTNRPDHSE